jgi:Tat protein secretion system quality control protein TatD with DNase activity
VAEIKGMPVEDIARITTHNFETLFAVSTTGNAA